MEKKRSCCCGALPPFWWWLLTLLGLPLLLLLMLGTGQGSVEKDLATRAQMALQKAGMGWAKLNIAGRGRDAQLVGLAPSAAERDKAAQIVQNVYGIRDVQNLLRVDTAAGKPLAGGAATAGMTQTPSMPNSGVTGSGQATDAAGQASAGQASEPPTAGTALGQMAGSTGTTTGQPSSQPAAQTTAQAQPSGALQQPEQMAAGQANAATPSNQPTDTSAMAGMPNSSTPQQAAMEKAADDCQAKLDTAITGKTILFETNKAVIKRDSLAVLDGMAEVINACKPVVASRGIEVGGHTDDAGNDAYNQRLSEQRANAVKDYLTSKGIDGNAIKAVGYGESKPVASNATEAGRAQNRRITFEIKQP